MPTETFVQFLLKFKPTGKVEEGPGLTEWSQSCIAELFQSFAGTSFDYGVYRIHTFQSSSHWSGIARSLFPFLNSDFQCFGYDWQGRQFAIQSSPTTRSEGVVLILDAEVGEVYNTKQSLCDFHNRELVEAPEEAVAESAFREWLSLTDRPLAPNECVGFSIPLRLGGKDELENRERIDMEVYWSICADILDQTEPLEEGTRIGRITAVS